MPVIAASEVRGLATTDDKQLKAALGQWLDSPPRRIDRLILQCLLAAAPLKAQVRSHCGLYLASAHPARATMAALLEATCVQHKQPKPFEFVNSVSNAAGFHIAQQLGIDGPNLFIGAGEQVWTHCGGELIHLPGLACNSHLADARTPDAASAGGQGSYSPSWSST